LNRFFNLCKNSLVKCRRQLFLYIAICIFSSIFSLIVPYINGTFIDFLTSGNGANGILLFAVIFAVASLLGLFIGYICNRLYAKLQTTIAFDLNRKVIVHLQKVSLSFFAGKDVSSLSQKINSDSNVVSTFCISLFQNIIVNLFTIVLGLFIVFSYNPAIFLFIFILIPFYCIGYFFLRAPLYRSSYNLKESQAFFFSKLYSQLSTIKQIKLFSIVNSFSDKMTSYFDTLMCSALKYQKESYKFSAWDTVIITIGRIFLFIYGGFKVIQSQMTIGEFTIITTYFSMTLSAIRYFFSLGKNIQDTNVSYERLNALLDIPEELIGDTCPKQVKQIKLNNLGLILNKRQILSNVNLIFEQSKIYVLMGANGSGKSSLLNAIVGLYNSDIIGDIYYDNYSIKALDVYTLRRTLIGFCEQTPIVFDDTIRYNIYLDSVHNDTVIGNKLISILHLRGLFDKLEKGVDTPIDNRFITLSGGEKQKITLMRALVHNPSIILLDEPTSALDKDSIDDLKKYLTSIKKNRIIIISTHDKNIVDLADVTINLDKGHIFEAEVL